MGINNGPFTLCECSLIPGAVGDQVCCLQMSVYP